MEFDAADVAIPKPSLLGLYYDGNREKAIGETAFDLSAYANLDGNSQTDYLPLKNCAFDSEAFIEINIRCKILD